MPSNASSTSDTILVSDKVLDGFARNAEIQKNICVFIMGAVIGCAYGAAVTFFTLAG